MPNDVITIHAITKELSELLVGGRIEKIYQPEQDEITLFIKNQRKIYPLVISANASNPRVHVTSQKKENSLNAPAFCMLLRKYLISGIINRVEIFNSDRIVRIDVLSRNELNDLTEYSLMVELMGRYSNIILIDSNNKIIDAIKRIHFDQSTTRYILPNLKYELQPQTRIPLFDEKLTTDFFDKTPELSTSSLLQNISGIGKETALEIVSYSCPKDKFFELVNLDSGYSPCLRYDEQDRLCGYFVMPYSSINGRYVSHNSMNECLDAYYSLYDGLERKKAATKTITTLLLRLQQKTERRIADNLEKLDAANKAEELRIFGELILSNIYLIKPSDESLTCHNYYIDSSITIKLDNTLSPAQNAQNYFKKYAKAKRAALVAKEQLAILYPQREYLESIKASIENSTLKVEFDEILDELNALSGYKKNQRKNPKIKPSNPVSIVIDGYRVYFGKNNLQNSKVTFEIASGSDLWLHVKQSHGTHLIIKGQPPEETIKKCAQIAAFYSEAKNSSKVDVDYTLRKFVKKIPGAMPGMVTYTNYNTILVTPCDYNFFLEKKE